MKTSLNHGSHCYPDPSYLQRVREELRSKGIDVHQLNQMLTD